MITPFENDPFPLMRKFWELEPWQVALIAFLASPIAIWLIELYRSLGDDTLPPYGLAVFRWSTVWMGDTFLAIAVGFLAQYYQEVKVEESWLTGKGFFVAIYLLGFLVSAGWILLEEFFFKTYPPGHKLNLNRPYHFFYMAWMVSMLLGGLRGIAWEKTTSFWLALSIAACYLIPMFGLDKNLPWEWTKQKYGPGRTTTP